MRTHIHCIHAYGYGTDYCGAIPSELSHTARRTEVSPRPGVASPRTRHTLSGSFDCGCQTTGVVVVVRAVGALAVRAPARRGALPCRDKLFRGPRHRPSVTRACACTVTLKISHIIRQLVLWTARQPESTLLGGHRVRVFWLGFLRRTLGGFGAAFDSLLRLFQVVEPLLLLLLVLQA